jgi:beta-hydroxylase
MRQCINLESFSIDKEKLINALKQNMKGKDRGMIFFKWYGKNINNDLTIKTFHQPFRYIKTIGISAFNKQCSTSRHFGPLRLSIRLLYNLKPIQNNGVYIEVAGRKHYWHNNPLFIFDDTRVHQSFNQADEIRYCMFVDILRPTPFLPILNTMLRLVGFVANKKNFIFYKNWGDISKTNN